MKKHESFIEKTKTGSRKVFISMGNLAAGNPISNNGKKGNMELMPFSLSIFWSYEKPIPKRKSK